MVYPIYCKIFISILMYQGTVESVFRFRDVLIHPDADPALIFSDFQNANKKVSFFSEVFFLLIFSEGWFVYISLKDTKDLDPVDSKTSGSGKLEEMISNASSDVLIS
jgi:hypothetical protein